MELRSLVDHVNLVDAICEARADDAANIAREHVKIDFELLEEALRRSGIGR
jgi:GntR family transcriptional repressor for pyruvate dehydrogenase complex